MQLCVFYCLAYKPIKNTAMNILKQPNNNLDELVFENRNKAYGTYVLRSNYDKNLKRSF